MLDDCSQLSLPHHVFIALTAAAFAYAFVVRPWLFGLL